MSSVEAKFPDLSGAELIFVRRMLPHFLAGKSVEESAKAILADDIRLFSALLDQGHSYFVDQGYGRSAPTREGKGDVIRARISQDVYEGLRATGGSQ